MNLQDLLQGTSGELKHQTLTEFKGLTTDSRQNIEGQVFVALKGDVHDGHKFLKDVVAKKAGAVISHEWNKETEVLAKHTTWIHVPDTLLALQNLAAHWRRKWGKTIIGITGSNGKTSVKDFTYTLLSGQFQAVKSQGSFNNHWGVPLTLLTLRPKHDIGVVEMGMNHAGEIARLCQLATPDIVMVNNVGRAHLEHFGTLEKVAAAKEEIYYGLSSQGTAVFNIADPLTRKMYDSWRGTFKRVITFGTSDAEVFFAVKGSERGGLRITGHIGGHRGEVLVPVWGSHNAMNLAAASALAVAAGEKVETIWAQLEKCRSGWGRNQWVKLKSGGHLLFDGYNANPDSFAALFKNVKEAFPREKQLIGVFGEMREQGTLAEKLHIELGAAAARAPFTHVFFVGASAPAFRSGFDSAKAEKSLVISINYEDSLASKIKNMLNSKSLVVVKGSRGGALERVVVALDPLDFSSK